MIEQYIRTIKNGRTAKIGYMVAIKDETVKQGFKIGYSIWNVGDSFDKAKGRELAIERASSGEKPDIKSRQTKEAIKRTEHEVSLRALKYFKLGAKQYIESGLVDYLNYMMWAERKNIYQHYVFVNEGGDGVNYSKYFFEKEEGNSLIFTKYEESTATSIN